MMKGMHDAELQKLSQLARIAMSPEELRDARADLGAILEYVSRIQTASGAAGTERDAGLVRNVMRKDGAPHESGINTEALLNEAPEREGEFVKVKKILP